MKLSRNMKQLKRCVCLVLLGVGFSSIAQGQLEFYQTNWGNNLSWDAFCERAKTSGYDGIEIWMPQGVESQNGLRAALQKHQLKIIFLNGTNRSLPFKEGLKRFIDGLEKIMVWKPIAVNCHTGSDFFTQNQNQAIIEAANGISKKHGIPVYHETHRGRFSYTLPATKKYLANIPELTLTLDISHWMVVHESLLQDQDELLKEVLDKSRHIHARVGYAEGPQVNDPAAPEWKMAVDRHLDIWEKVIKKQWTSDKKPFTITTEFGPADYMQTLPYTRVPVADQWKVNVYIMNAIKQRMRIQ